MKTRFAKERSAGALADAYLLVGASRTRLREEALACAASLLESRGPVHEHADFALFDPVEFGSPGLKVEHIAFRKEGVPCVETALRYRPKIGKHRAIVPKCHLPWIFHVIDIPGDAESIGQRNLL